MILLVGAVADGNVLLSLDDPSVSPDEVEALDWHYLTNPINFGRAATGGRLRRIAQSVTANTAGSVTITPYADGDEFEEQAVTVAFDPALGSTQVIEAEVAVDGQRFSYKVSGSGFTGPVAFGEADLALIRKRQ